MQNEELQLFSPRYDFSFLGGEDNQYIFLTKNDILYEVRFRPSGYIFKGYDLFENTTFEFAIKVLDNPQNRAVPFDSLIRETIAAIFLHFFERNDRVVVYICDTSDARGMARFRKFNSWYYHYQGDKFFSKFDMPLADIDGKTHFTSLIFKQENPNAVEICTAFMALANSYREHK